MKYHVIKDGAKIAETASVVDAMQFIEDDAVDTWSHCFNPNAASAQLFPGVDWDNNVGYLEIGHGGVEYVVINPTPSASWITMLIDDHPAVLIVYDNESGNYEFSQELVICQSH